MTLQVHWLNDGARHGDDWHHHVGVGSGVGRAHFHMDMMFTFEGACAVGVELLVKARLVAVDDFLGRVSLGFDGGFDKCHKLVLLVLELVLILPKFSADFVSDGARYDAGAQVTTTDIYSAVRIYLFYYLPFIISIFHPIVGSTLSRVINDTIWNRYPAREF